MSRSVLRLLALPAALAVAAAVATLNPAHLAGAEFASEADVFAAADDPALAAVNHSLDQQLEAVATRTALKEDLTDQLLAGRIGLAAAAEGFLDLNRQVPECMAAMRLHFPAYDDRTAAAHNVMEYARQRTEPAAWPAVARRLEAQLRALGH